MTITYSLWQGANLLSVDNKANNADELLKVMADLNKLGKKYGAQVGETKVNTGIDNLPAGSSVPTMKQEPVRYLDITPEMRKAIKEGQPLASIEEELAKALA